MSGNCQTSRSNVLLCSVLAACVSGSAQSPQLTPANAIQTLFFIYSPAYCNLHLDAASNETGQYCIGRAKSRAVAHQNYTTYFTPHSYLFIIVPFYFFIINRYHLANYHLYLFYNLYLRVKMFVFHVACFL